MTVENSPKFSDLSPTIPSFFEGMDLSLEVDPQIQHELGSRALMVDEFVVLGTPEVGHKGLERFMRDSIIGQNQAIDAILEAMDRSRVRMHDDQRPLVSLAFLGPTGVGKSETAKVLAEYISGGDPRLVKIDCSDFSHGHEVAKLTGAPPGYVGRDRQPFLSKKRIERPGVVVLFDEIEKGSEELYNLMLQILGDGKLQLNDDTETSFRDATIILTSNLGAKQMNDHLSTQSVGFSTGKSEPNPEVLERSARQAFKDFFKPEFVNRLDKMVVFNPLDHDSLTKILDSKFFEANKEYSAAYGVEISATSAAYDHLIEKALEERNMGARPLVRAFEQDIQTTLGRHLSSEQITQGSRVQVYHQSECPLEVRRQFSDSQLIFTHRFDEDLWEYHEAIKRKFEEDRRELEEARKREAEKKKSTEVIFVAGSPDPDSGNPDDEPKDTPDDESKDE